MFSSICMICTGNICRSPVAEALMRAAAVPGVQTVFSAGTHAMVGHPADDEAIALMQARNIDLTTHRAQQATAAVLAQAELILALDQSHLDWLRRQHPHLHGRTFKLLHWTGGGDVPDPYRQGRGAFIQSQTLIERGLLDWCRRLSPGRRHDAT